MNIVVQTLRFKTSLSLLYIISNCFFGNSQSLIHPGLVKVLEDVDAVGNYTWAAITYATFLAGLRRKVTGQIGAFTGFWQFLAVHNVFASYIL